jgi:16S rRNA (cytosine1402-N4)-methyltransferase
VSPIYHTPVLVDEVVKAFTPLVSGTVLDGTVGGGGHALALLEAFPEVTLLGTDRDPEALRAAEFTLSGHADRVRLLHCTFDKAVAKSGVVAGTLSGALLDLGVSGHQLDANNRGFTFRRGAVLDMRMDPESKGPTAAGFLNESSSNELAAAFRDYGDIPRAGRLARAIIRRREREPFRTSDDLVGALSASLDRSPTASEKARLFQSVRIAINAEIESLESALPALRDALAPQGTIVVIAYHSVEDRAVKHAFREWSRSCVCPVGLPICACRGEALGNTITRKPISPTSQEIETNPRARSARLRAWRKAA